MLMFILMVNMWCAHTINPIIPIDIMANVMFIFLNVSIFPLSWVIICENIPNLGRIRMYTSGCPKNQNKCWYRIGLPLPDGLKNDEFML